MAINLVCIVRSADGRLWGVGSDCVAKTEDKALGDKVKIAIAKRRRVQAAAKAAAARAKRNAAWNASPSEAKDAIANETNAEYRTRKNAETAEIEAKRTAAKQQRREAFAGYIEALMKTKNAFLTQMAWAIEEGPLTYRQADCTAKHFHRRGTEAHSALAERFMK